MDDTTKRVLEGLITQWTNELMDIRRRQAAASQQGNKLDMAGWGAARIILDGCIDDVRGVIRSGNRQDIRIE